MGRWSDDIFGNDLAADVAVAYRECIDADDPPDVAVKAVRRAFAAPMREADDRRVVWIALAATQLDVGGVTDDVRTQALKAIAWCEAPARDPDDFPFALDALAKLREALGGKSPAAKPAKPKKPPGVGGEVLAVSLPNDGGEKVLYIAGPSKKIKGDDVARVVWLFDLDAGDVTPESVHAALTAWRNYREVYPSSLGRRIGCYDAKGTLSARKTRLLLRDVPMPPAFERRMESFGEHHKAADLPWVVEYDANGWKTSKWAVDPEIKA